MALIFKAFARGSMLFTMCCSKDVNIGVNPKFTTKNQTSLGSPSYIYYIYIYMSVDM